MEKVKVLDSKIQHLRQERLKLERKFKLREAQEIQTNVLHSRTLENELRAIERQKEVALARNEKVLNDCVAKIFEYNESLSKTSLKKSKDRLSTAKVQFYDLIVAEFPEWSEPLRDLEGFQLRKTQESLEKFRMQQALKKEMFEKHIENQREIERTKEIYMNEVLLEKDLADMREKSKQDFFNKIEQDRQNIRSFYSQMKEEAIEKNSKFIEENVDLQNPYRITTPNTHIPEVFKLKRSGNEDDMQKFSFTGEEKIKQGHEEKMKMQWTQEALLEQKKNSEKIDMKNHTAPRDEFSIEKTAISIEKKSPLVPRPASPLMKKKPDVEHTPEVKNKPEPKQPAPEVVSVKTYEEKKIIEKPKERPKEKIKEKPVEKVIHTTDEDSPSLIPNFIKERPKMNTNIATKNIIKIESDLNSKDSIGNEFLDIADSSIPIIAINKDSAKKGSFNNAEEKKADTKITNIAKPVNIEMDDDFDVILAKQEKPKPKESKMQAVEVKQPIPFEIGTKQANIYDSEIKRVGENVSDTKKKKPQEPKFQKDLQIDVSVSKQEKNREIEQKKNVSRGKALEPVGIPTEINAETPVILKFGGSSLGSFPSQQPVEIDIDNEFDIKPMKSSVNALSPPKKNDNEIEMSIEDSGQIDNAYLSQIIERSKKTETPSLKAETIGSKKEFEDSIKSKVTVKSERPKEKSLKRDESVKSTASPNIEPLSPKSVTSSVFFLDQAPKLVAENKVLNIIPASDRKEIIENLIYQIGKIFKKGAKRIENLEDEELTLKRVEKIYESYKIKNRFECRNNEELLGFLLSIARTIPEPFLPVELSRLKAPFTETMVKQKLSQQYFEIFTTIKDFIIESIGQGWIEEKLACDLFADTLLNYMTSKSQYKRCLNSLNRIIKVGLSRPSTSNKDFSFDYSRTITPDNISRFTSIKTTTPIKFQTIDSDIDKFKEVIDEDL